MGLLIGYVLGAVAISFLCSLLEAALLSTQAHRLVARRDAGQRAAGVLLEIKEHRIDDAISAILTLNTVAHTIGATLAGAQAAVVFGSGWVGVFSAVLTFLVLVLTEIVPKTLGTVHADGLVPFVAWTLRALVTALAPVLVLSRALTRLVSRGPAPTVSRGDVLALVTMAARAGALRGREAEVLRNVMSLERIRVEDVMTPRTVIRMLPADATAADLLDDPDLSSFSRIPVRGRNKDEVRGYVLVREALAAAAREGNAGLPLRGFLRTTRFLPETASLRQALEALLAERELLTIVVDDYGGVSGLITLEDVVETLLGAEIVDETDRDVDLRQAAAELRDRRLRRTGAESPGRASGGEG